MEKAPRTDSEQTPLVRKREDNCPPSQRTSRRQKLRLEVLERIAREQEQAGGAGVIKAADRYDISLEVQNQISNEDVSHTE